MRHRLFLLSLIFISILAVAACSPKKKPPQDGEDPASTEVQPASTKVKPVSTTGDASGRPLPTDRSEPLLGNADEAERRRKERAQAKKRAKAKKRTTAKKKTTKKANSKAKADPESNVDFPEPLPTLGDTVGTSGPKIGDTAVAGEVPEDDRAYADDAQVRAISSATPGSKVTWKNPSSGNSGEIRPGITYKKKGKSCRQYTHLVTVKGTIKSVTGTLCKDENGVWREK